MTTSDTPRALVLAALMVLAPVAGTVALSGSATATPATDVTVTSVGDVQIGQSSTSQTVEFQATLSPGNTTNVSFSASGVSGLSLNGVSGPSSTNGNVTASVVGGGSEVRLTNTAGSSQTTTVTATLDWDTSGVSSTTSGGAVTLTADGEGTTGTGSFDVVGTSAPADSVTVTHAGDVTAGRSSTTQTVQFDTTLSAGNSTTFDFSASGAGLSQTSVFRARDDAGDVGITQSGTQVTLTNTAGSARTTTVTAVIEWDSTGVSTTSGDAVTLTVDGDGTTATGGFDVLAVADRKRSVYGASGRVFLGEENVDVTGLDDVDPTSSTVTFQGVSGQAEDEAALATVDPTSADITEANGFTDGGFSVSGSDADVDLRVSEPNIFGTALYLGSGTGGADITNKSIPTGSDTVTVEAEYNFEEAARVEVVVRDEDNLDITPQVVPSGGDRFIDSNGGTQELDLAGLDPGNYTVVVRGVGDFDGARQRMTFRIREQVNSLALDSGAVTKGATVVATAQGTPGDTVHVRIDEDDLDGTDDNATAERVFRSAGDVVARFGSADVGSSDTDYVAAAVELDDDGEGRLRIDTEALSTGDVDVELALGPSALTEADFRTALANDSEVSVDLEVGERTLALDEPPSSVTIGEAFTITGSAPETDVVKAYVRIDSEYVALREEGGTQPAQDFVDSDGDFEIEIGTSGELAIPDSYRITVVGNPVAGGVDYADDADTDGDGTPNHFEDVDSDLIADFEPSETFTLRTTAGEMTARLSSSTVAVDTGDEVTLSGTASGQGDSVRVYVVGPRGDMYDLDGSRLPSSGGGSASDWYDSVSIRDDDEFEEEISGIDRRGTYRVVVVARGRDGSYAGNPTGFAAKSQEQVVEIVQSAYDAAGSDDVIVPLTLNAESASLSLNLSSGDRLPNGEVTVDGTSNRENETTIFLELLDNESTVVAAGEGEVDGEADTWSGEIDLSGVEPGTYTLRATDDRSATRVEVEVVDGPLTETPTGTPTEEPTPTTATPSPTPTDTPTPESTPRPTSTLPPTIEPTDTTTPGFTPITALVALLVVVIGVLALRRD